MQHAHSRPHLAAATGTLCFAAGGKSRGSNQYRRGDRLQIFARQPLLFHSKSDGFYWVGPVNRLVLRFIGVNQGCEHTRRSPSGVPLFEPQRRFTSGIAAR